MQKPVSCSRNYPYKSCVSVCAVQGTVLAYLQKVRGHYLVQSCRCRIHQHLSGLENKYGKNRKHKHQNSKRTVQNVWKNLRISELINLLDGIVIKWSLENLDSPIELLVLSRTSQVPGVSCIRCWILQIEKSPLTKFQLNCFPKFLTSILQGFRCRWRSSVSLGSKYDPPVSCKREPLRKLAVCFGRSSSLVLVCYLAQIRSF